MIDIRELAKYQYFEKQIKIICVDGQELVGMAGEVDDEEESGLDEPGITLYLENDEWVGIGISEIERIVETT
ncbi:MAG: hypothetical protein IJ899_10000 [Blautia sp.]|nr:hypothetical protein [Blautia sp.]